MKKANRVDFEICAETDGTTENKMGNPGEENPGKTTPIKEQADTRQDQTSHSAEG